MPASFTPFLAVMTMLLSMLLAWCEIGWLRKTRQMLSLWPGLVAIALWNCVFIVVTAILSNTYFVVLLLPVPLVPCAYVVGKLLLYVVVVKQPVRNPFWLALITLPVHTSIAYLFLLLCSPVDPHFNNMKKAIEAKRTWALEVMMWVGVRDAVEMRMLVNEAIVQDNPQALNILFRHGADAAEEYWLQHAKSAATQWVVIKFLLDNRPTPDHRAMRLDEYALNYSVKELHYCLAKGFEPRHFPHILHYALSRQPLQNRTALRPEEYHSILQKMQLLLDHGADINGEDHHKFQPLFTALILAYDMDPVLHFMLARGANINAQTVHPLYPPNSPALPAGVTPLILAIATNRPTHVATLLQYKADLTIRDSSGRTAWDYAVAMANPTIQALGSQAIAVSPVAPR